MKNRSLPPTEAPSDDALERTDMRLARRKSRVRRWLVPRPPDDERGE